MKTKLLSLYLDGIGKYGMDNVGLIAPVKDGPAGVKRMNELIRENVNPASSDRPELQSGKTIRHGDRVTETENGSGVVNGDVGYITEIKRGKVDKITVSLSGATVEYPRSELYHLKHAYCLTVHKAQGSEYALVITCLQEQNRYMIRRSPIYTALTRGKTEVVFLREARTHWLRQSSIDDRNERVTGLPGSPHVLL